MQTETEATDPPAPGAITARANIYALIGYFLLALVVTWPLALHFTQTVPGDLIADRDQNLWNLWWAKESLFRPTNPYWTDALYHPYGAPLYYHTLALPLGLIGLIPQLLLGLPAAYNTVILAAFTLSGYGAFRLALLFTPNPLAAFLGGVVYAFTPYTLDALKGQTEVLSVQWLPLYAEAFIRAVRTNQKKWPILAGIWLAITALTSLYYAIYAALFTLAYLAYTLTKPNPKHENPDNSKLVALTLTAAITLLLTLPLLWGLVAHRNDPRIEVAPDITQKLAYSADLLSFFALPHDHPLIGNPPRPGASPPPLHSYLSLGYVALGLSILGIVVGRRRSGGAVWFWVALGLTALVLSLGPELQVAGQRTGVPLPYRLLEWVPGWDAVAKIERLVVLARLCMAVLAALGAAWLLGKLARLAKLKLAPPALNRILPFAATLALLVVELPIHPRYIEPLAIPGGFHALSREPGESALMELPFATRQAETLGRRMLGQTVHERPIMGGYLARSYGSPIADTCSPFWGFISARHLSPDAPDIITPQLIARPLDVLRFHDIGYIALYSTYGGPNDEPLAPDERAAFLSIISQVSTTPPISEEPYVTIYKIDDAGEVSPDPALLIGNNWHDVETSGGAPLRWMRESTSRLCVFAPRDTTLSLRMEGTAFATERTTRIEVAGRQVYAGTLPTDGAFAQITTAPIEWRRGMTEITIFSPEPGVTPRSLDPASPDTRALRAGFREVRLESTPPK